MKNKEHFEIRSMEFLLKSWSGEQNFYINLRGGGVKIPSYMRECLPSPPHKYLIVSKGTMLQAIL